MHLETKTNERAFEELNHSVLETKNHISASAASVLIIQNGTIVNEWYCGYHESREGSRVVDAESQFNIASVRKTYLGLAISLALHEGRVNSLDDRVTKYLDDLDESVLTSTTIRHLLTHTHGLYSPNKRIFPVGTDWKYNNVGVNLLVKIVGQVFDKPLTQVIKERVFLPYGFTKTGWRKVKNESLVWLDESFVGENGGEANLFVNTRELGYWGYIHLTKGYYQGNQILPESIFQKCTTVITPPTLDESLPRNGFFWWVQDRPRINSELGEQLPNGSYQSLGFYGNSVLVIPEYNVVVVRMLNQIENNPSGYDYLKDIKHFGNLVAKCILSQQVEI